MLPLPLSMPPLFTMTALARLPFTTRRAGIDRRRPGIGVVAAERERSRADLDQRPSGAAVPAAVGDDAAHRGREVVGADGELLAAQAGRAGALDRARRRPGGRERGYVEGAAGIDDEARLPAAAVLFDEPCRSRVRGDGGVGARAVAEEVSGPAIEGDDEVAGRAGRQERQVAVVAVDGGRSHDRARRAAFGADMQDAAVDRRAAGVGVVGEQEQRAAAGLGEAAAAGDAPVANLTMALPLVSMVPPPALSVTARAVVTIRRAPAACRRSR